MSWIMTHVLDTTLGRPAEGIRVDLEQRQAGGRWKQLSRRPTDGAGRIGDLWPPMKKPQAGVYRLTFHTEDYFASHKTKSFYPYVSIIFKAAEASGH